MMLSNKKFLKVSIFISVSFCLLAVTGSAQSQQFGAVLVAHGSNDPAWNQQVEVFYESVSKKISDPLKLAYLLSPPNLVGPPKLLQNAVQQLRNSGVTKIVLVHLSPSSYSQRHQDIVDFATDTMNANPSLTLIVPPAMDGHPRAIEILKEYAQANSSNPSRETLILIGYGAKTNSNNQLWENQLRTIGRQINQTLNFRQVETMTLRNQATPKIQGNAIGHLKQIVKLLGEVDKVVVVPYVLCSRTNFHKDIKSYLKGMAPDANIELCEQGVIDHVNTEAWVIEVIANARNTVP